MPSPPLYRKADKYFGNYLSNLFFSIAAAHAAGLPFVVVATEFDRAVFKERARRPSMHIVCMGMRYNQGSPAYVVPSVWCLRRSVGRRVPARAGGHSSTAR